jgi:hypothetical protein
LICHKAAHINPSAPAPSHRSCPVTYSTRSSCPETYSGGSAARAGPRPRRVRTPSAWNSFTCWLQSAASLPAKKFQCHAHWLMRVTAASADTLELHPNAVSPRDLIQQLGPSRCVCARRLSRGRNPIIPRPFFRAPLPLLPAHAAQPAREIWASA